MSRPIVTGVQTRGARRPAGVTERCVFELTRDGLLLTEVAPGVDIRRDIVERMAFEPIVREPRTMDARIFRDQPMGLREDLLRIPFDARFRYDAEQNVLFVNFEKLEVRTLEMVDAIRSKVHAILEPLGHKVYAVVNYEGFELDRDVEDAYVGMVKDVVARFYQGVTRYTTSSFMRAKLGGALERRALAPHIFETADEARAGLK